MANLHDDARRALEAGRHASPPDRLARGLDMETNEQALAQGRSVEAWNGFTQALTHARHEQAPIVLAQVLQRRAAAGAASGLSTSAADDLLEAADLLASQGQDSDAEACRLAAAGLLASADVARADRVLALVERTVPADGAAAARRGLIGAKVALAVGDAERAIEQLHRARQGALDVGDPVSYLAASVEAAHTAESTGDGDAAYAELARAWGTLSDLVGRSAAEAMVKPELTALRQRLGPDRFHAAKVAYETSRRTATDRT